MKCEHLGIDIQDDMGRHEVGFVENTVKTPVGNNNEGCLFEARFHINKVLLLTYISYQRKNYNYIPLLSLKTSILFKDIPFLKPVPSALLSASLAANLLA